MFLWPCIVSKAWRKNTYKMQQYRCLLSIQMFNIDYCLDMFRASLCPSSGEKRPRVRVKTESDGTRRSTGGEVKGKEATGVGCQHSCTVSEHGLSSITTADAHTSAASSQLNWHPRRYKWTRPFRWKTESGFCACAITFRFHSTAYRFYW